MVTWWLEGRVALVPAASLAAGTACELPAAAFGWGEGAPGAGALKGATLWPAWPLRAALGFGLAGPPLGLPALPPTGARVGRGDLPTAAGHHLVDP